MAQRKWRPRSIAEIEREIEAIRPYSRIASKDYPRAASARYDRRTRRVEVELRDGWMFAFPARLAQGLSTATAAQLSEVDVIGDGYALRWESLDADFTVEGLLAGRVGSELWMREHARKAGSTTSAAKAKAARRNGRKGGRPRKVNST